MAKKTNNYFKLMEEQTAYCVQASDLLDEVLSTYSREEIEIYRRDMHELEHRADEIRHDILSRLSTEFITPIDQEDILRLVQTVDDITDAIDEVILDLYMYGVEELPPEAPALAGVVNRCVKALHEATAELKNFKKPEALRACLVKVNDIEAEADEIYIRAVHDLCASDAPMKRLLGAREVYESLEECCDLCERAADIIEQTVIKNT